jgi:hypothetical protein
MHPMMKAHTTRGPAVWWTSHPPSMPQTAGHTAMRTALQAAAKPEACEGSDDDVHGGDIHGQPASGTRYALRRVANGPTAVYTTNTGTCVHGLRLPTFTEMSSTLAALVIVASYVATTAAAS